MKEEYDFTQAERGKFYRNDVKLNLPVYLDEEVQTFLREIADKKEEDISSVVNEILRSNMQLLNTMK